MAALGTIVVVGASLAGLRAVEALRSRGFDGDLVLIGAERHLPYDRPPLSKEVLRGEWDPTRTSLTKPEKFEALSLDLRLGSRAVSLDPSSKSLELDSGESVAYDGLILATGARPLPIPGAPALDGVHVLRTLDESMAIAAELDGGPKVVVVGAGFIGAEAAASCRARGLQVTLIEALPVPLGHVLGTELGEACAALHRDHGVELLCGVGVSTFDGHERVERVQLADGRVLDADVVIVGIGVTPEIDWLESSGLALGDGVLCDATLATSAPGIVAAEKWLAEYKKTGSEPPPVTLVDDRAKMGKLSMAMGRAYEAGEYQEALEAAQKLYRLFPDDVGTMYNTACMHCLVGHHDEAYSWLEKAVEAGYDDADHLSQDGDFKAIRDQPRFQKLIDRVRSQEEAEAG